MFTRSRISMAYQRNLWSDLKMVWVKMERNGKDRAMGHRAEERAILGVTLFQIFYIILFNSEN